MDFLWYSYGDAVCIALRYANLPSLRSGVSFQNRSFAERAKIGIRPSTPNPKASPHFQVLNLHHRKRPCSPIPSFGKPSAATTPINSFIVGICRPSAIVCPRMPRLHSQSRPSQWPIWLLVAAWFCANCPPTLICASLVWLGEARSFTHQQRLKSDIAHLLAGEKPHSLLAHVPSLPVAPDKSALPPLPALKKIELAAEGSFSWIAPRLLAPVHARSALHAASALRAPPPHGPPRAEVVS